MVKFFAYDNTENKIILNEPEILLVKEFADLWTNERNACDEDPTGKQKLRAFKELTYIYMAIDWGAPGSKDTEYNRHLLAVEASGLTEDEQQDEVLKAACRKYKELQDSSSYIGQIVESYKNVIHKMKIFIDNIDYSETKDTGEPIFKIRDTLAEMQAIPKALAALKEAERQYKEEIEESTGLRGNAEAGMFD